MKTNPHAGHRERMRKELIGNGITENTPPHRVLEFLLFYSVPVKDTNKVAHRLLERFGTLSAVLDADEAELLKIEGVGTVTACHLKSLVPIFRYYEADKRRTGVKLESYDAIGKFLLDNYVSYPRETISLLSLNSLGKVLGLDIIGSGDTTSATVNTRVILNTAMRRNATVCVLAHSHPGGIPLPSENDIESTKMVKTILETINIRLADHIIIGDNDYVSLRRSSRFSEIF